MTESYINENFFNTNKTDYESPQLLLSGVKPGLFDTIHKSHPKIWSLYKQQKTQAWSESEFDYAPCARDMKSAEPNIREMFIRTLSWQWESDAAFAGIGPLLRPFISSTELWAAWQAVSDMEVIHSATYSEIVRNAFDDPSAIIAQIMADQNVHERLRIVGDVLGELEQMGHKYALGLIPNDQTLYNAVMNGIVALFLGERCQFMAAFAVTFAIGDLGVFMNAARAIQLIARDEYLIHSELDKTVIETEMATERGRVWRETNGDFLEKLLYDVVESELVWTHELFADGRSVPGLTDENLSEWVTYCSGPVYKTLGIESPRPIPRTSPLKFMANWLDLGHVQPSPQEQEVNDYRVNATRMDDEGIRFDF